MNDAHKYILFDSDPMLMNQMNETSIRQYWLGISKFNSSDRGYYWCQMVVNNVTLPPSPYGHIHSQCLLHDVICNIDQPICVQDTRAQHMAFRQVNGCFLINFNTISPTRSTANIVVYDTSRSSDNNSIATAYPTVSRERVGCD